VGKSFFFLSEAAAKKEFKKKSVKKIIRQPKPK